MTTVEASPVVEAAPARHRFTTTEYYAMAKVGILGPGARTELIEGDIYDKMTPGPRHAFGTRELGDDFKNRLGRAIVLSVQSPLEIDDESVPEPDLVLLRPRADRYRGRHPGVGDVFLLVEVSDTTLAFDRTGKIPMYARAGIPEVWVINLVDRVIETYSNPTDGAYRDRHVHKPGDTIAPKAFPDCQLPIDDVLA